VPNSSFSPPDPTPDDPLLHNPPTAAGGISVSGSFLTSNYHALSGPLGDFTLRGKSSFSGAVSTSSDFSKFYVDAYQAVPTPGTAALLGLGGLLAARRRR